MLLIADQDLLVRSGAGAIEERIAENWLGKSLAALLGLTEDCDAAAIEATLNASLVTGRTGEMLTARLLRSGEWIVVELEPWQPDMLPTRALLGSIDRWADQFERAPDVAAMSHIAAEAFRQLTGYDRVMIYRFLPDGSGQVIAEARSDALPSLMNHYFPASDIPRQARALYLRNRIRVIPDIGYTAAPLRPAGAEAGSLDMSDVSLRSVSPVHLHYMRNMQVAASASISLVIDGTLWGLIACHNSVPRQIGEDVRNACTMLAGVASRQARNKGELLTYQERLRIRSGIEVLDARVDTGLASDNMLTSLAPDLRPIFPSDGFALITSSFVSTYRTCPKRKSLMALADWISRNSDSGVLATHELVARFPEWEDESSEIAGVLAIKLPLPEPATLIWMRAEIIEVVEWAGHPHKEGILGSGPLQPRNSFDTWRETVRGRARPWDNEQLLGARRLRRHLIEYSQKQQLRELNTVLNATLRERESLLGQKDFLIREVNHRVQNSLQLVASFLKLQSKASDGETAASLSEAQRRIAAIGLVHRRLYRDDYFGTIDLARYIEELADELCASIGPDWQRQLSLSLIPLMISADRAINIGLIVTELVINISKYAYDGAAGPITISLSDGGDRLRLSVTDKGSAPAEPSEGGFGTRMMQAIVQSLSGTLAYETLYPGLCATLTVPVDIPSTHPS